VVFNWVTDLPGHDQPELGAFGMIMPVIGSTAEIFSSRK
jgi:hypothetical protein